MLINHALLRYRSVLITQSIASEDFFMLCRDIGLERPTMLQQKSMGLYAHNMKKGMVVEVLPYDGALAAGLIPLITSKRSKHRHAARNTIHHLMLISKQIIHEAGDMVEGLQRSRECAVIGKNANARDDIPDLKSPPQTLISYPERIIDHIRRDNITLSQVGSVTIIRPDRNHDSDFVHSFDQDVLFISSKIPNSVPYYLYTDSPEELGELKTLFTYPRIIARSEWYQANRKAEWMEYKELLPSVLTDFLYARGIEKSVILCPDNHLRENVSRMIAESSVHLRAEVLSLRDSILPLLEEPAPFIVYGLHSSMRFHTLLDEAIHSPEITSVHIFLTSHQRQIINDIQEKYSMDQSKQSQPTQEEILGGKIRMLADQVKLDKHPEELVSFKKLMKRHVPFHLRSYLLAYLLRDAVGSARDARRGERSDQQMVTLFVSIGKSKKVFPKDLVKLFTSSLTLKEDDIGTVRVLDNYSFVNISEDYAKQAVETMDSIKFRGRNITVNFAKKKTG